MKYFQKRKRVKHAATYTNVGVDLEDDEHYEPVVAVFAIASTFERLVFIRLNLWNTLYSQVTPELRELNEPARKIDLENSVF